MTAEVCKPLYVGSTPTRASNNLRADFQTTVLAHARTSSSEFNEDHRDSSKITLIHSRPAGVMAIESAVVAAPAVICAFLCQLH
jgi:hypothetical protein